MRSPKPALPTQGDGGRPPAATALSLHAVTRVIVEQPEGDLVEGGLHGGDLGEHVDAVAVVLDHALDAADLALDPGEAVEELRLGRRVAAGWGGSGAAHGHSLYPAGV